MMEGCFSLGFLKPGPDVDDGDDETTDATKKQPGARFCNFGSDNRAIGGSGTGGAFAFCDPLSGLAFCYTPNRGGGHILDDPREFALRSKAFVCTQK